MTVFGNTMLNNLGVTGNITAGVMTIQGLDATGNASINTVGDLKLQNQGVGGIDILNGKIKPDKTTEVHIPALTITQDELSKYKDLPPSRVVTSDVYTPEWVEKNLESH